MYLTRNHLLLVVCLISGRVATGQPSEMNQTTADKEIRAAAESFVNSFNQRDAAALAAHWTEEGVYVDEDGQRFQGRKSIQGEYEALFKSSPENMKLQIEIDSIRLLNSQTAVEEGRAALVPQPLGETRVMSRYCAVHVRQDGQWLMSDVRDSLVELPADLGQLEDLNWLVGQWSAKNKDVDLDVKFRWIENNQFLAREYKASQGGKVISQGLQIIGVDPTTEQIISWTFSGDGSHAMGVWAPHENGWVVDSTGVTRDGIISGALEILSQKDKNTFVWKSTDRTLGEEPLPDTPEITLKRK